MKWRALVLAAAVVAVAADAKDDANKKDLDALQGSWKVQKLIRGGDEAPGKDSEKVVFLFEGNKVSIDEGRPKKETATFKLDATKKPKAIDFVPETKKESAEGVYDLDGDTLKLCFTRPGTARPKEVASEKGSETILVVLKRQKK
jgi:uncharacterized protein (TIGR03067 family)